MYDYDKQDEDDYKSPETDDEEEEEEEKVNGEKMEVEETHEQEKTPGMTEVNGTGEVEKPVSNGDSLVEVCIMLMN